ncbi:MAG: hypothetical protein KF901_21395 [Myxococcales bacterium]|nr:hypothetical protein [Myxococcales bacterium]
MERNAAEAGSAPRSRKERVTLRLRGLAAIACALGLGGCSDPPLTGDGDLTTSRWASLGTLDDLLVDEAEPFDPRLATMFPGELAGRERLCDLVFVGTVHALRRDELDAYAEPEGVPSVSHRATVRCRATTGEGWADLTFAKESSPLASYVRAGARVRVRVRGVEGFEGYPVLEFLAQRGDAPTAVSGRTTYAPVRAGARFDGATPGATLPCGVVHAGTIRPVEREGASHAALVTCRHPTGETTVDVSFAEGVALSALHVQRGEVVPLQVLDAAGATSGHPTTAYAGP